MIHLSIYLSIYLVWALLLPSVLHLDGGPEETIHLSIYLSIYLVWDLLLPEVIHLDGGPEFIYLSIYLSIYLFTPLSIPGKSGPSFCLQSYILMVGQKKGYIYISIYLSIYLSILGVPRVRALLLPSVLHLDGGPEEGDQHRLGQCTEGWRRLGLFFKHSIYYHMSVRICRGASERIPGSHRTLWAPQRVSGTLWTWQWRI